MDALYNPDRSAALWYDAARQSSSVDNCPVAAEGRAPVPSAPVEAAAENVNVWLFGALATVADDRQVAVPAPADATVGDVLAALVARRGADFNRLIFDADGALSRCCRLFVDGNLIEDLTARLPRKENPAEIEVVLLSAYEGG